MAPAAAAAGPVEEARVAIAHLQAHFARLREGRPADPRDRRLPTIQCLPNEPRARPSLLSAKPPRNTDLVRRAIRGSALPLSSHQQADLQRFDDSKHGLAVCYATGLGKTLVAASCAVRLALEVEGLRVLYVAPKSLQSNLETAIGKYVGDGTNMRREGAIVELNKVVNQDSPISLVQGVINLTTYTYEGFYNAWVRDIGLASGAFLIFDEAHHAKTDIYTVLRSNLKKVAGGKRGKRKVRRVEGAPPAPDEPAYVPGECRSLFKAAIKRLKAMHREEHYDPIRDLWTTFGIYVPPHAPHSLACVHSSRLALATLCLTATPFYNNAADGANLVSMVRGEDPFGRAAFLRMLGVAISKADGMRIGYDEAVFRRTLRGYFAFQDPDPARDPSLPRTLPLEIREVKMTPEYQKLYEKVESEAMDSPYEHPWTFYNGVRMATNNVESKRAFGDGADLEAGVALELKADAVENPKCAVVIELIRAELARDVYSTADPGRTRRCGKVIVHSTFITCGIRIIQAHLRRLGIAYAEITGRNKIIERTAAIQVFNDSHALATAEPRVRVLFITDAGSEGIDPRGQTLVVKYEPPWNPSARDQAFGRGSRRGALDHLAPAERVVRLVQLILVKTGPNGRGTSTHQSADYTLYHNFTERKEREINDVMRRVRDAQV